MTVFWSFWADWIVFCGLIMGGYLATASGLYWLVYSLLGKRPNASRNRSSALSRRTIMADIQLSALSVICFSLIAACFTAAYRAGLTKVYVQVGLHSGGYLLLSYAVVLILQDAYFYFIHRLFHTPALFRRVHRGHHRSKPPTPWTFFALDPAESVSQAVFLLGITIVMPLHLGVLVAVLITMTLWSVGNHLGLERAVPVSRASRWCGRWLIGSAHHLVHHYRYDRHYGLYFTFWDRLLSTEDSSYRPKTKLPDMGT